MEENSRASFAGSRVQNDPKGETRRKDRNENGASISESTNPANSLCKNQTNELHQISDNASVNPKERVIDCGRLHLTINNTIEKAESEMSAGNESNCLSTEEHVNALLMEVEANLSESSDLNAAVQAVEVVSSCSGVRVKSLVKLLEGKTEQKTELGNQCNVTDITDIKLAGTTGSVSKFGGQCEGTETDLEGSVQTETELDEFKGTDVEVYDCEGKIEPEQENQRIGKDSKLESEKENDEYRQSDTKPVCSNLVSKQMDNMDTGIKMATEKGVPVAESVECLTDLNSSMTSSNSEEFFNNSLQTVIDLSDACIEESSNMEMNDIHNENVESEIEGETDRVCREDIDDSSIENEPRSLHDIVFEGEVTNRISNISNTKIEENRVENSIRNKGRCNIDAGRCLEVSSGLDNNTFDYENSKTTEADRTLVDTSGEGDNGSSGECASLNIVMSRNGSCQVDELLTEAEELNDNEGEGVCNNSIENVHAKSKHEDHVNCMEEQAGINSSQNPQNGSKTPVELDGSMNAKSFELVIPETDLDSFVRDTGSEYEEKKDTSEGDNVNHEIENVTHEALPVVNDRVWEYLRTCEPIDAERLEADGNSFIDRDVGIGGIVEKEENDLVEAVEENANRLAEGFVKNQTVEVGCKNVDKCNREKDIEEDEDNDDVENIGNETLVIGDNDNDSEQDLKGMCNANDEVRDDKAAPDGRESEAENMGLIGNKNNTYKSVDDSSNYRNLKSEPICCSTPVRQSHQNNLGTESKENKLGVEISMINPVKLDVVQEDRGSEPLCASTPLAKPSHGLRIRDTNIPNNEANPGIIGKSGTMKQSLNMEKAVGRNIDLYMDMINESEIPNIDSMKRAKDKKIQKHKSNEENLKRESRHRSSKRDKKMKETRKEKFKEYMGPGLTSGTGSENAANYSKVRNTDIETCTLTEYKGFGLTGPLPEKHASSDLTNQHQRKHGHENKPQNFGGHVVHTHGKVVPPGLTKLFPSEQIISRPAGTEGLLLERLDTNAIRRHFGAFPQPRPAGTEGLLLDHHGCHANIGKTITGGLSRSNSFNKKVAFNSLPTGPALNSVPNLHAIPIHGILRSTQSHGALIGQQQYLNQPHPINSVHPAPPMGFEHVGHPPIGLHGIVLTDALQPDQAYPDIVPAATRSSNPPYQEVCQQTKGGNLQDKGDNCAKGDKSENSAADHSNKSDKFFDPAVLQCDGQLKVSAYMNFGLLTVHVVQGRQFSTKWKPTCDSFVKMSLIPDDGKKPKCKTQVVQDSNTPVYDEKFSFELNEDDHSKRLLISVWHRDNAASLNEFLGCMSFGLRHLTNPKKEVNGWYYLLTEDIGRKKHLQVSAHRPQPKSRNTSNIPAVNKDVWGSESLTLTLHRGKNGFGFTVIEACPVRVGRVDRASPAETAGLHPADIIIRLNKQNVSRSTSISVAKLIKNSGNAMVLEVQRPKPVTYEHIETSTWKSEYNNHMETDYHHDDDLAYDTCDMDNDQSDHTVPQMFTIRDDTTISGMIRRHCNDDDDKEIKLTTTLADETLYTTMNPEFASLATSTPLPLLAQGHRTVQTSEMRKHEAIHRLLSLELDFIDLMHAGMSRYSRPLRHCILSHSQHAALFQNIEKLTTISEYHVKQMHDNAPNSFTTSEDDTDTSGSSENHSFIQSIGLIYQSKIHMLCQAYDLYAKGITRANQILSDLRRSEDFVRFVQEPRPQDGQPSISAFIYRPVQHVRELYRILQEIFLNTPTESSDYNSVKQVVEGLQECTTAITNYSCDHMESMSSLTSRDSKTSRSHDSKGSKGSLTASMKSRSSSARSATSASGTSCSSGSCRGQGHLLQTSKSVDMEVMKIQDRLVFSANVPVFQLCQDDRHILYSGDMFKWEGKQWRKIHIFLFTDMILQTVRETDGYLRVLQEPTMLRDISAMDAQRSHATEFVLYSEPKLGSSSLMGKSKLHLRAPSTEQKFAWKSLIEQRVFSLRGSMDYFSSTSDISSSSASAIII